jgi:hypothetical protein
MKIDRENLAAVRQCCANAVLSHKVQEVAAERKGRHITWFKIGNIAMLAAVLILFIVQTGHPANHILAFIGAGLTAAGIILLIIQLTFGIEQEVVAHKNSALKYMDPTRSLQVFYSGYHPGSNFGGRAESQAR